MPQPNSFEAQPESLPPEYAEQLGGISPESEEYRDMAAILFELLAEERHSATTNGAGLLMEHEVTGIDQHRNLHDTRNDEPPRGYKSAKLIPGGAHLDPLQFNGTVYSFAGNPPETTDVLALETENGVSVRICDLRPYMTSSVRKGGPRQASVKKILDKDFYLDVKKHVEQLSPDHPETSPGGKSLTGVSGVRYSSISGSQVRTYWMAVKDLGSQNVLTIARLADCNDGANFERDLYRRVFNVTLSKK